MIIYLLESSICLLILFGGYIILKKNTPANLLRIYLLGMMLASTLLPLMNLEFSTFDSGINIPAQIREKILKDTKEVSFFERVREETNSEQPQIEKAINTSTELQLSDFIPWCYFLIVAALLGRFLFGLVMLVRLKIRSRLCKHDVSSYYDVGATRIIGASFFGWIFIGNVHNKKTLDTILKHELIHKKLGHSVDIILAEIYRALFWINPISWLVLKEILLNNEFETDHSIVNDENNLIASDYSNELINLASSEKISPLNLFSASSLEKRIRRMNYTTTFSKGHFTSIAILFILVSMLTVSCEDPIGNNLTISEKLAYSKIKSITTRFVSHQHDTMEKDNGIVAVTEYDSAGRVSEYTQHMTYPYNLEEPQTREFWAEPDVKGILLSMDGLHLSHAEKNFWYGNQWPAQYAKTTKDRYSDGIFKYETTATYAIGDLPKELKSKNVTQVFPRRMSSFPIIETFEYFDGKVSKYEMSRNMYIIYPKEYKDGLDEEQRNNLKEGSRNATITSANFQYEGDHLVGLSHKNVRYNFIYDIDRIVKSEYYLNDQLYNYRDYFYDDSGLKTKTEVYNVNLDLEYTIYYEYQYY